MALALARLGAGANNGKLILIDNDKLSSLNLGRHVLGKNYLYQNKATVLKKEIENQLPNMNIEAYPNSILNKMGLMADVDLNNCMLRQVLLCLNVSMKITINQKKITAPIIHAGLEIMVNVSSLYFTIRCSRKCLSLLY
ncbi:ThiF family adenylyltransferase [Psychrobacter sp. ER1]|uniref:ThiF family adenylyltransferase n=1 Tax=Psychrobacter sp. ER1 TaxID=3406645 RepID=UPI003B43025E